MCRSVRLQSYVSPAHYPEVLVCLYLALECLEIGQTGMTSNLACEVLLFACQDCVLKHD